MQQRFSTCNATMLHCRLQQFVAHITSPLRILVGTLGPYDLIFREHFLADLKRKKQELGMS